MAKEVKKCCPFSQTLDLETFSCIKSPFEIENVTILPENMLNISREKQYWNFSKPTISDEDLIIKMVQCSTNQKVLNLSNVFDYSLTLDGSLISLNGAYQPSMDLEDFCLDLAYDWALKKFQRKAIICDPCVKVNLQIYTQPLNVVYFDQRLGAAHPKCWSK